MKLFVGCSLEPGLPFDMGANAPPNKEFIEDEKEDVPEVFRDDSVGDAVEEMVKRDKRLGNSERHFVAMIAGLDVPLRGSAYRGGEYPA